MHNLLWCLQSLQLVKRRRHGLMADVDWMDGRVFREIEHVNEVRQNSVQLIPNNLNSVYSLTERKEGV